MKSDWVKLHRKIQRSPMYKSLNSKQRDILIQLLLMANYSENKWLWNGKMQHCEPGQFISSLESIKEYCAKDVSIQNIKTALKKLKTWEFLTNESTKQGRKITIINWSSYQGDLKKSTDKSTDDQPTPNRHLTPNKKVRKKEGKNNNVLSNDNTPVPEEPELPTLKCPQKQIINLYHQVLPELNKIEVWNETSRKNLKSRWREDKQRQSLSWWEAFFQNNIRVSDFLMGRIKDFQADLGWIVRPTNFQKTINGFYKNRGPQTGSRLGDNNARVCEEFINDLPN